MNAIMLQLLEAQEAKGDDKYFYLVDILNTINKKHERTQTKKLAKSLSVRILEMIKNKTIHVKWMPVKQSVEFISSLLSEGYVFRR